MCLFGFVAAIFYDCDLPMTLPLILLENLSLIETLILENDVFCLDLYDDLHKPEMLELWKHGDVAAIFYAYDLPSILPLILPSILLEHWSHIETLNLKMICVVWMSYWCVCNGNAGPSEMLFMQPRTRSGSEHSCYLFAMFDFAKYLILQSPNMPS